MPRYCTVLVEPEFEESVGFIARAMKNFRIRDLRLVNPVAKLGRTGRSRAGHAQDVLDNLQTYTSLGHALESTDLAVGTTAQRARSTYRILRRPITPRDFSGQMSRVNGNVALVFGREGTGLTNAELDACDLVLTIPAAKEYPTLNISHAAVTIFYELFTSSNLGLGEMLASSDVKRAALAFLNSAAQVAGLTSRERGLASRSLRNVMGRSAIRAREASSLTGVFRAISNRLDNGNEGLGTSSKEL